MHNNNILKEKLSQPDFSIPSDRVSLEEDESLDKWRVVAHVRVASEVAATR